MPRNHSFADDPQPYPSVPGFDPGGDAFGVIRMIDGHMPWAGGIDGANTHVPSSPDHGHGPAVGLPVDDDYDGGYDDSGYDGTRR